MEADIYTHVNKHHAQFYTKKSMPSTYLCTGTLKSVKEAGVNEGRLRVRGVGVLVLQTSRDISGHSEVGILIDGAGNEAGDSDGLRLILAENVGEGRRPTAGTLDTAKVNATDVGAVVESEDGAGLVEGDVLGQAHNVLVEGATHKLEIAEDEGLVGIEADSNDILGVVAAVALNLLDRPLVREEVLLVVGHHDDQRNIEGVLKPFCELEGNGVAHVDTVGRRAAAGVEEEGLALLITVEDKLEVAVGEDNASPEEAMGLLARDPLEAIEQGLVDLLGAEFLNQLVVVDGLDNTILADFALDLFATEREGSQTNASYICKYTDLTRTDIVGVHCLLGGSLLLDRLGDGRLLEGLGVDVGRHVGRCLSCADGNPGGLSKSPSIKKRVG